MRASIPLRIALRSTTWKHWGAACVATGYSLLGGMAPLWIGWLIVKSTSGHPHIIDFSRQGEFALYAAALLAPAFYMVVHDRSEMPFAGRPMFVLLGLAGVLLAVACYTMVAPQTSKAVTFIALDRDFVGRGTIWLFVGSLAFSLIVIGLDNARTDPEVWEIVKRQQQHLENDFDRL
jgi:hypothetical protein